MIAHLPPLSRQISCNKNFLSGVCKTTSAAKQINIKTYRNLASLYLAQGDLKKAEAYFNKLLVYSNENIKVDNTEHLYLTDDFIVTHNTFEEKVNPYLMPMFDSLDELVGKAGLQRDMINHSMEIAPIGYLRGRTFKDAICLLDEAQNCTYAAFKLYLTRIGSNSKLIMFTSGTTGVPKSIEHSMESLTRNIKIDTKFLNNVWGFAYNPTHMAGIQVFFQAFFNKNTIVKIFEFQTLNYIKNFKFFIQNF